MPSETEFQKLLLISRVERRKNNLGRVLGESQKYLMRVTIRDMEDEKVTKGLRQRYSDEAYAKFRKYQTEYNRTHYKRYNLRFRTDSEKDYIAYIDGRPEGFSEYIKGLVKADMEKNK